MTWLCVARIFVRPWSITTEVTVGKTIFFPWLSDWHIFSTKCTRFRGFPSPSTTVTASTLLPWSTKFIRVIGFLLGALITQMLILGSNHFVIDKYPLFPKDVTKIMHRTKNLVTILGAVQMLLTSTEVKYLNIIWINNNYYYVRWEDTQNY